MLLLLGEVMRWDPVAVGGRQAFGTGTLDFVKGYLPIIGVSFVLDLFRTSGG